MCKFIWYLILRMYAVVDLQGHQYIVSEKDEIVVDNVDLAQ
nr:bL21 family ribosomal protein [bacterium]